MVNEILFKQKLIALRLTQRDLSEKSGVPLSTISSILKGHCSPTGQTIKKLCDGLEITDDAEIVAIFLN